MAKHFSPETMDFLWGIRLNNERPWFEAHKQEYVEHLYEPMKALGQAVYPYFKEMPGMELKVSRIYRDARLHPPVPYKETLWFSIRRPVDSWSRHPTLYFQMSPEGGSFGFLLWQPKIDAMEQFRKTIAEKPEPFINLVRQAQEKTGLILKGESYKRPKPCPKKELESYFSWRGKLEASESLEPGPRLFDPDLGSYIGPKLAAWYPLCEYFYGFTTQ